MSIGTAPPQIPDLETAKAAHDCSKDAFFAQEQRHSTLIAKSQTLSTVGAIIFAVISLSSFSFWPSKILAMFSFGMGTISIWYSLSILITSDFSEIQIKNVLLDSSLLQAPEIMLVRLARSYEEAFTVTSKVIDDLQSSFDWAVKSLKLSAVGALLAFILQLTLGEIMTGNSNNNNNQNSGAVSGNTTSTPQPAATPLETATPSFGVQGAKRSFEVKPLPIVSEQSPEKKSEGK
jgi:hypothetical protein